MALATFAIGSSGLQLLSNFQLFYTTCCTYKPLTLRTACSAIIIIIHIFTETQLFLADPKAHYHLSHINSLSITSMLPSCSCNKNYGTVWAPMMLKVWFLYVWWSSVEGCSFLAQSYCFKLVQRRKIRRKSDNFQKCIFQNLLSRFF